MRRILGVRHQVRDAALRFISARATAPFLEVNGRFAAAFADGPAQKFAQGRVVAHHHDGVVPGVLVEHLAEIRERGRGPQGIFQLQLALVTHFVAYQRSGLRRPLQRDSK